MKIKKILRSVWFHASLFPLLTIPQLASAEVYKGLGDQGAGKTLTQIQQSGGANSVASLPTLIGGIIGSLLGILGIILVVYIVQAGIMYMTAGGDTEKVKKAKQMIIQAVIGMIIIVAAYSISTFVIGLLTASTTSVVGSDNIPN